MIQVELDYSCGGCDAREKRKTWIKRRFMSFSGRDHGIGANVFDSQGDLVEATCPEGWMAFDPYTQCTYCPRCWAEIEEGVDRASNYPAILGGGGGGGEAMGE